MGSYEDLMAQYDAAPPPAAAAPPPAPEAPPPAPDAEPGSYEQLTAQYDAAPEPAAAPPPADDAPPPDAAPPPTTYGQYLTNTGSTLDGAAPPVAAPDAGPEQPSLPISDYVNQHSPLSPDQQQAISGWVPPVEQVGQDVLHGNVGQGFLDTLSYLGRPFVHAAGVVGQEAMEGAGLASAQDHPWYDDVATAIANAASNKAADPSGKLYQTGLEDWAKQNPDQAQAIIDQYGTGAEGGQALMQAWYASQNLPTTPGWDNPLDVRSLSDVGHLLGSITQADPATVGQFAKGMAVQTLQDPLLPAQVGLTATGLGAETAAGRLAAIDHPLATAAAAAIRPVAQGAELADRAVQLADPVQGLLKTGKTVGRGVLGLTDRALLDQGNRVVDEAVGDYVAGRDAQGGAAPGAVGGTPPAPVDPGALAPPGGPTAGPPLAGDAVVEPGLPPLAPGEVRVPLTETPGGWQEPRPGSPADVARQEGRPPSVRDVRRGTSAAGTRTLHDPETGWYQQDFDARGNPVGEPRSIPEPPVATRNDGRGVPPYRDVSVTNPDGAVRRVIIDGEGNQLDPDRDAAPPSQPTAQEIADQRLRDQRAADQERTGRLSPEERERFAHGREQRINAPRRAEVAPAVPDAGVTPDRWLSRDENQGWLRNGQKPSAADLLGELQAGVDVPPDEWHAQFASDITQPNVPAGADGHWARVRAAAREGNVLYDDWSRGRLDRQFRGRYTLPDGTVDEARLHNDLTSPNATTRRNAERAWNGHQATRNFIDLNAGRVMLHGQPEVDSLAREFHDDVDLFERTRRNQLRPGEAPSRLDVNPNNVGYYWKQRAEATFEALDQAGHQGVVELQTPEGPMRYDPVGGHNPRFSLDPDRVTSLGTVERQSLGQLAAAMRSRLDGMGLKDVAVRLHEQIVDPRTGEVAPKAVGLYWQKIVHVATDGFEAGPTASRTMADTLNHEAIHAARDAGFFNEREWGVLARDADRRINPESNGLTYAEHARQVYAGEGLSADEITEEAVADMAKDHYRGRLAASPETKSLIGRLVQGLRRIGASILGSDSEDVLRRLETGDLAKQAGREAAPAGIVRDEQPPRLRQAPPPQTGPTVDKYETLFPHMGVFRDLDRPAGDAAAVVDAHNVIMPKTSEQVLSRVRVGNKRLLDVASDTYQDALELQSLAQQDRSAPLTGAAATRLAGLQKHLNPAGLDVATMDGTQVQHLVRDAVRRQWHDVMPEVGTTNPNLVQKVGAGMDRYTAALSRTILYNPLNVARFAVQQLIGNGLMVLQAEGPVTAAHYLFQPGEGMRAFNRSLGKGTYTRLDAVFHDLGLAKTEFFSEANKDMLGASVKQGEGKLNLLNVIAPEKGRLAAAVPDVRLREVTALDHMTRDLANIQDALPQRAGEVATAMNRKYGGRLGITERQVQDAVESLQRGRTVLVDPTTGKAYKNVLGRAVTTAPRFSAKELRDHLVTTFHGQSGVDATALRTFADRTARDYAEALGNMRTSAADAVKRSGFDFEAVTKLDQAAQHVFMFHFWNSRASKFYATEMLRNPAFGASYYRMMGSLQQEAKQNNYPDWLTGSLQFLNTPAGMSVFMRPGDLLNTFATFADWQYGTDAPPDYLDLTPLGKARARLPFMLNPLVDLAGYATGGFGPDADIPDVFGMRRPTKMVEDLLNLANSEGMLPDWVNGLGIGVDASGNKVPVTARPGDTAVATFANKLSTALKSVTGLEPVQVPDMAASRQASLAVYIEQAVRAAHPDWDDDQVYRQVTAAEMDPSTDEYQQAERTQSQLAYAGPDLGLGRLGLPDWVERGASGAFRWLMPLGMTGQNAYKFGEKGIGDANATPPLRPALPDDATEQQTRDRDDLKYGEPSTVAGRQLKQKVAGYWNGGDPKVQAAATQRSAIYNATITDPVTVSGVSYSAQALAALSKSERWDVASRWADEQGVSSDDIDAMYKARDAALADPDVAAYLRYTSDAKNFPGGKDAYVADLAAHNPALALFIKGSENPTGKALSTDGFLAATGGRPSVYDPVNKVGDDVPYFPGVQPGTTIQQDTTTLAPDQRAEADQQLHDWQQMQAAVDQAFPGSGLVVGRDYLPKNVYGYLKGQGYTIPKSGGIEEAFVDWAQSGVSDDIDDFYRQWAAKQRIAGGAGGAVPSGSTGGVDVAAIQQGMGVVPAVGQQPVPDNAPRVVGNDTLTLRSGPGTGNSAIGSVGSGVPLRLVSQGPDWSQVAAPDGTQGWVATAYLLWAAA